MSELPLTWTADALARIRPELKEVPHCRDCGRIPKEYARLDDGTVQCAGASRRACLLESEAKP